jgi:hypothetical protein
MFLLFNLFLVLTFLNGGKQLLITKTSIDSKIFLTFLSYSR